jgi:hypothetical protein
VRKDLAKVKKGEKLSPVLLLRGSLTSSVPLTVADGYHRICVGVISPQRIADHV